MSIGELRIGSLASTSYCDAKGLLLIAKGVMITPTLVEKLRRHGVETLHVGLAPSSAVGTASASETGSDRRTVPLPKVGEDRRPPQKPRRAAGAKIPPTEANPRVERRSPPRAASSSDQRSGGVGDLQGSTPSESETQGAVSFELQPALRCYSPQKIQRLARLHLRSLETVDRIAQTLVEGRPAELQATDPVIDGYTKELADDPDPVIAGALLYEANLDLATRCLQFSTLALAVGLRMEISSHSLRELGRAALIHDWGLFELPPDRRFPHHKMTDAMRQEYQQHPLVAEAMMQSIRGSTFTLAVLVAQVHELMNGTGFPRRIRGDAIHPLSRVLCVIDTYLTLTSPPQGHPRIVPCDAIAFLLNGVKTRQYAPTAVASLLETVTLYPIGSLVELSDATRARVVRSNGRDYGYPIVERIDDPGAMINLKEHSLFVTRPVLLPEQNEVRLPDAYTDLSSSLRQP